MTNNLLYWPKIALFIVQLKLNTHYPFKSIIRVHYFIRVIFPTFISIELKINDLNLEKKAETLRYCLLHNIAIEKKCKRDKVLSNDGHKSTFNRMQKSVKISSIIEMKIYV